MIVGAGPGGPGRRRLRRLGGPQDDRRRARGARRPGRHLVPDRELPRLPAGVSGDELASRALQQARRLGAEILVTRSILRIDAATRQLHLDGGDVLARADDHPRLRRRVAAAVDRGFDRLAGKGISYGAARSEAPNTHGLDIHIVGAGNSAGQAALFFSTHARSVTIVCRGESLEKSMSRYLIDQIAARPNIARCSGTEVAAVARRRSRSRRSTSATRATGETTRLESGGLFIFIGADAETAWLPTEIALDRRGYVLTGSDMRATRALDARSRPVPARDERAGDLRLRRRALRPGQARRGRRRRGQHGDRVRAPVPEGDGASEPETEGSTAVAASST